MNPKIIIEELEKLNYHQKLSLAEMEALENGFTYAPLRHYLQALKHNSKPETASSDLLKKIFENVLAQSPFAEVKLRSGFIDFAIQENSVNPILIELKPGFDKAFDSSKTVNGIYALNLEVTRHKDQISKYLTSNDFIILTNLNKTYLFNRDAIIDFKPFYEISFTELLKLFLDSENLWDTVRRLEDLYVKPELEQEFFTDLVKWYEQLNYVDFIEKDGFTKGELVVLLINKIIFIKTLEDYGLIPYKFLTDEYFSKYNKWEIKGIEKILNNFFTELEEWFWDYYDTELFRTKIWDYIVKTKPNLVKFERIFEKVLGVGKWEYTFGKGMVHYNYRKIDEDVFGKAYETFIAKTRKDSGIYYTHRLITQYMSEQIVKHLFGPVLQCITDAIDKQDFETANIEMQRLYRISIADTTSGSGSFLIKALREIYTVYKKIADKLEWVNHQTFGMFETPKYFTDAINFLNNNFLDANSRRKLIASIILRHIHAIDLDDRALETAKTNMWKEAVKLEKGLFNFRKLGSDYNHILPNLQINFLHTDTLYDLPIPEQLNYIELYHQGTIKKLQQIRDAYLNIPTEPDVLDQIQLNKQLIREGLLTQFPAGPIRPPAFICLEFFYLYFDAEGMILPAEEQGFSGIISNPPWEEIYPVAKEFASIGKFEMDKNDFEKAFQIKLNADTGFKQRWEEYQLFYKRYSVFVAEQYHYHQLKPAASGAMRSHLNLFKLLFERDVQLLKSGGYLNILIPSSFQTDEGSFGLRQLAFMENSLVELYSFENRGFFENGKTIKSKIFQDVDSRFKFSIVFMQKTTPKPDAVFRSMFYLTDPNDLYTRAPLNYSLQMVRSFSPHNLSIMEFEKPEDYALCTKIRGTHPLLREYGYNFRREFNVTDDAEYFSPVRRDAADQPVVEGKMIHQFNSSYSKINNFVSAATAHYLLLSKEIKRIKSDLKLTAKSSIVKSDFVNNNLKLDYQTYRLVYRAIGRSTDERTLIATIIPPNEFTVNSINYLINCSYALVDDNNYLQNLIPSTETVYLMALMNSLTLNYFIRNKISANLNMFYLYELPIPEATEEDKKTIIKKAFALLYYKSDSRLYDKLREDLNLNMEELSLYADNLTHNQLRAELEVFIAQKLYGLNTSDWQYLTSTFTYGENPVTRTELNEIIKISNELIV